MTAIEPGPRMFGAPTTQRRRQAQFGVLRDDTIGDAMRRVDAAEAADEALRRVEAVTVDIIPEAEGEPMTIPSSPAQDDPAPSLPAVAKERALQLVTNISTDMLAELRSLRDEIDGLMRDCNERRDAICEAVRAHAEYATTTIEAKTIIAEGIKRLRDDFDRSRTPLPPARKV